MVEARNADYYRFLRDHPLVRHLLGKVWHATSLENYSCILRDGFIRPNDGSRVGVYKRRAPGLTVCEQLSAVSLFDFDRPEGDVFPPPTQSWPEYFLEWGKFLAWYEPLTFILVLQRSAITASLASNEECRAAQGQWIYNVEVCHRGPLPVSAIEETIIVWSVRSTPSSFRVVTHCARAGDIQGALDSWTQGQRNSPPTCSDHP